MIDISVQNVVKAFEKDKNILDGISFDVNSGERVGLLGKNGAGKTTLFKVIMGEYEADEGSVIIGSGKRTGLISQIPVYPEHYTTEDVLKTAHSELYRIRRRMEAIQADMDENTPNEILREYDALSSAFAAKGGYDMDTERNKVANGLDISASMRAQLFSSLSGGEKTRVNLARLILEQTDILLLDEPTNHLDMRATEWLEEYLTHFKGTVLTISHDRYFLDKVVSRIVEIVAGKAEFYSGNYSFYVQEKEARYQEKLKQYEKEMKEAERLSEAADRLYAWGTGNKRLMQKSFAIEKRIQRLKKTERPVKEKKIYAQFGEKDFRGDEVLYLKNVCKSYGERRLFETGELLVGPRERIAVIGDNGTGKSTFLKLIVREEEPDGGLIKIGPAVKIAYLPQTVTFSDPYRSVLDTVIYEDNCTPQTARNRLGAFKFSGEDVFKPIEALSGGERSRLKLCMLMKDAVNLLILDEPTNHLDTDSREWIEQAVENYSEALLFVSHDRYFISRFATRIWELRGGTIVDFRGSFEEYRRYCEQRENSAKPEEKKKAPKEKKKQAVPLEKRLAAIEREIEACEKRIGEIDAEIEKYSSDYQKLEELFSEKAAEEQKLENMYGSWNELAES